MSSSPEPYHFEKVEAKEDTEQYSTYITGLKPFTMYDIVVKAYNSAGSGPKSVKVMEKTLETGKKTLINYLTCYIPYIHTLKDTDVLSIIMVLRVFSALKRVFFIIEKCKEFFNIKYFFRVNVDRNFKYATGLNFFVRKLHLSTYFSSLLGFYAISTL